MFGSGGVSDIYFLIGGPHVGDVKSIRMSQNVDLTLGSRAAVRIHFRDRIWLEM